MSHTVNERIALATMRRHERAALRYDGTLPAMHKEFIPAIAKPVTAFNGLGFKLLVIGLAGMAFVIGAASQSHAKSWSPKDHSDQIGYVHVYNDADKWDLRETVDGQVYVRDHGLSLDDCSKAMIASLDKNLVCADVTIGQ